ncbi:MAG: N-acetyltransferase [Bacteroidetes bacterium]|nr:N-acetyltransferase [Bacteroidota bacterium]
MPMEIRPAQIDDAAFISEVYNHHVRHTVTTFETVPVSVEEWKERISTICEKYPFLVSMINGQPVGYCYATTWKTRQAYAQTVEVSVYIHPEHHGRGIGKALYSSLFQQLKEMGIHCVIGGISMPNMVSERLHQTMGFQLVGTFREVGNKFGEWVDVRYYQLTLT